MKLPCRRFLHLAAGVAALACGGANAEDRYPSKPVRIVVSFSAGGPTDTVARVMGARMAELLGQQFVVENKAGAGGNIDAAFDNVGSITTRVRSGEVRALAVLDDVRSKFLPDVPTMKEVGYPTVMSNSTRGIAGPKDMPAPIVNKLREVLKKAMENPEHVKKLEDQGIAIKIMVGEEYAKCFVETHGKAKKYTEWAKNRPQK